MTEFAHSTRVYHWTNDFDNATNVGSDGVGMASEEVRIERMAAQVASLRLRAFDDSREPAPPLRATRRADAALVLESGEGVNSGDFIACSSKPLLVVFTIPLRPLVDREEALVQRVRELAVRQVAHLAEHALLVHLVLLMLIFTIVSGYNPKTARIRRPREPAPPMRATRKAGAARDPTASC